MSFYVYMLECADGSIYTGHTDELGARLAAHQLGTSGLHVDQAAGAADLPDTVRNPR